MTAIKIKVTTATTTTAYGINILVVSIYTIDVMAERVCQCRIGHSLSMTMSYSPFTFNDHF